MSTASILFMTLFAAVLAALLVRSPRASSGLLALAGGLGAAFAWADLGAMALLLPVLVLIVGATRSLGGVLADRRAHLSAEEEKMLRGPLAGLGRGDARRFLDQGLWMEGRAGDTLTREGDKVTHLYWLAEGEAEVVANGAVVGRCGQGQLIGEATILSPDPATATVRLTRDARFWCAPAKALSAFLAAQPHTRHALEHGFTLSLKDKLDAMNKLKA
jgi:hypothetical protein